MAVAYQRKWFVNDYFARITLRKCDRNAEFFKSVTPFFDTWEEAHQYLTNRAQDRLKKAKAELPAAERNIKRVAGLKTPNV